jgi:hypothetical protein
LADWEEVQEVDLAAEGEDSAAAEEVLVGVDHQGAGNNI